MKNLYYCLGLTSFQLYALNANRHSVQKTARLSCTIEYKGSQFKRTSKAASELARKHFLIEFQFLRLPKLRFSVWVIGTLILSCAASLIK